jgi:hypothetical protein
MFGFRFSINLAELILGAFDQEMLLRRCIKKFEKNEQKRCTCREEKWGAAQEVERTWCFGAQLCPGGGLFPPKSR